MRADGYSVTYAHFSGTSCAQMDIALHMRASLESRSCQWIKRYMWALRLDVMPVNGNSVTYAHFKGTPCVPMDIELHTCTSLERRACQWIKHICALHWNTVRSNGYGVTYAHFTGTRCMLMNTVLHMRTFSEIKKLYCIFRRSRIQRSNNNSTMS